MAFPFVSLGLVPVLFALQAYASCTDESRYCGEWAADGECQKNPGYMLVRCTRSCGACGGESTTEISATTASTASTTMVTSSIDVTTSASTSAAPTATTFHEDQCHGYDEDLHDMDLAGTLLLTWQAHSMDGCCSKCDQTPGCHGFSYRSWTCYLKTSLSGTYAQPGVRTRLRTVLGDCSGFDEQLSNVDLAGQLVHKLFAASSDLCCSACKATMECEGFSYYEQFCYLKSNLQGTYDKTGCVVQLKQGGRRLSNEFVI